MSLQDFILPLSGSGRGECLDDWYGIHVRVGESLGARVDGDRVRYLYADEPTLPGPGQAIRIRSADPDVCARLKALALPEEDPAALIMPGRQVCLSIVMSGRMSRRYDVRPIEEAVRPILRKSGFSVPEGDAAKVRIRPYRIQKGRAKEFIIPGCRLSLAARIEDPETVRAALAAGIGRDRGLGFGMIVIGEEI